MEMRQTTRTVRLERWAEILRERQASGMSVTAWCEANGVDRQRYFYWQRKLREAACEAVESCRDNIVPTQFAEYKTAAIAVSSEAPKQMVSEAAVVVHLPCGRVEICSGADRETIENTLVALSKLC